MSHGVTYAQESIGKCHTSHTGSIRHLGTGLHVCSVIITGRKIFKHILHSLQCQAIRIIRSHHRSISFQRMSQDIHTGGTGQTLRLAHHIICINDRHVRKQLIIGQRILYTRLLICDNRERSYLRTCTGRGRNRYKISLLTHLRECIYTFPDINKAHCHILEINLRMLIHHPHDLTGIHSRTAAQCNDYIRLKC